MTVAPVLRTAAPEDAAAVASCHVACWREAYAHLLSPAFLDRLDVAARQATWVGHIASGPPVPVALVGDEVVGFACAGAGRSDDEALPDLELFSIYLLAAYQGTGTAQRLLDAAIGDRAAYLWVAEDNPRAHSFYRRNGFRPDGTRVVEPAYENMAEVRMVRAGPVPPAPTTGPASPSR